MSGRNQGCPGIDKHKSSTSPPPVMTSPLAAMVTGVHVPSCWATWV